MRATQYGGLCVRTPGPCTSYLSCNESSHMGRAYQAGVINRSLRCVLGRCLCLELMTHEIELCCVVLRLLEYTRCISMRFRVSSKENEAIVQRTHVLALAEYAVITAAKET